MVLFDIFKRKESSKAQKDIICNHNEALPNSVFCPKCGAKIEHTAKKTNKPKRIINFDINNCYVCVLHFRRINTWITPRSHPVKEYVVVYNGEYNNDFLECTDDGNKIRIKANRKAIILEFNNHTEKIAYSINKVCSYHVPIYDARESWSFIISDSPIQHELFIPGYQRKDDSIYYNIEDMQEAKKKIGQYV